MRRHITQGHWLALNVAGAANELALRIKNESFILAARERFHVIAGCLARIALPDHTEGDEAHHRDRGAYDANAAQPPGQATPASLKLGEKRNHEGMVGRGLAWRLLLMLAEET